MKYIPTSLARDLDIDADIDISRLMRFVSQSYGIGNIDLARRYNAYCDVNLSLKAEGRRYFFKLHTVDPESRLNIIAEKINTLSDHGVPVARIYPDRKGRLVTVFNGKACVLQTYALKGQIGSSDLTKEGVQNLGRNLALMNKIGTAHDPDNKHNLSLNTAWSPDRFDLVLADFERLKGRIPDDIRIIIRNVAREWERASGDLAQAKRGFIHNDYHLGNLKRKDDQPQAIFDFSDASFSWLAADVAAALQYMFMPYKYKSDQSHISHFMAGYQAVNPLPDHDLKLIPLLMAMRSATRVVCNLKDHGVLDPPPVTILRTLSKPEIRQEITTLIHR